MPLQPMVGQPVLKVNGVPFPLYPGIPIITVNPGVTAPVTLSGRPVRVLIEAWAGGGGGSTVTAGSGAGGGGGAYIAALSLVLFPNKSYTFAVGAGGIVVGDGAPTYITNDTDGGIFLLQLGAGTHGSNGASIGIGGTAYVGAGGVNGANGTGSFADPQAGITTPVGTEIGGDGGASGDGVTANRGIGAQGTSATSTAGVLGAGGGGPSQALDGAVGGNGLLKITYVG